MEDTCLPAVVRTNEYVEGADIERGVEELTELLEPNFLDLHARSSSS